MKFLSLNLQEILQFRELLYFLTWRDIKVRYKQAALGAAWVILQPLVTVAVYSAIFGAYVKFPSKEIPYHLYVFVGLWPWLYFANVTSDSGNILVNNAHLITKVYFPRIFLPAARVLALLSDFAIMGGILLVMLLFCGMTPVWTWLFLPVLIPITIVFTFSISLFFSALNVRYRDFQFVIPFVVQLWMFCSPIIYPLESIPSGYRAMFMINPMVSLIECYHDALFGAPLRLGHLSYLLLITIILFCIGCRFFERSEQKFAEIL